VTFAHVTQDKFVGQVSNVCGLVGPLFCFPRRELFNLH
jgi:hypothetical protein